VIKAGIGLATSVGQTLGHLHGGNIQSKDNYRLHNDIDAGISII